MRFLADPRRRSIALLTGGAVLVFVLLGTLNWFNTSNVDFLNPETYGQTMALTALEVLLFLLLLLLLLLLFAPSSRSTWGREAAAWARACVHAWCWARSSSPSCPRP